MFHLSFRVLFLRQIQRATRTKRDKKNSIRKETDLWTEVENSFASLEHIQTFQSEQETLLILVLKEFAMQKYTNVMKKEKKMKEDHQY